MLDIDCACYKHPVLTIGTDILDHNGKCHAEYSYLFIDWDESIKIGLNWGVT